MERSPNAKPVPQDLEYAFALFWGIGRVYNYCGVEIPEDRFEKVKFPTRDTKPTEKECRAALARILTRDKIPFRLLCELAAAIHPEGYYASDANRRIKFEKLNQGHHDAHRDFTIAAEVAAAIKQGKGQTSRDEACIAVVKRVGLSFERVRDIYQEQKAFLDALDKAHELGAPSESEFTIAAEVRTGMRIKGESCDKACTKVAKRAGLSFKQVRDIYQEQKAYLDALEKTWKPILAPETDLPPASDS